METGIQAMDTVQYITLLLIFVTGWLLKPLPDSYITLF